MRLGAATKGEERVSQLHRAAPNVLPPQPNAGTVSPWVPLWAQAVSHGAHAALAPGRQSLTGDGSDAGWLALPAPSQAGDADVVVPAWFQSRQGIRAGGGWELLAMLGPPWQGQRGVRERRWGLAGMQGLQPAVLTFSQAPEQAVARAASHWQPGQAQAVLRGLGHLEAADGVWGHCLRCGAEGRESAAGVPSATLG